MPIELIPRVLSKFSIISIQTGGSVNIRKRRDSNGGPDSLKKLMAMYLKEKFDINENDPGILDIIQSTTSVGGGSSVQAEAVTKNIKKCSQEDPKDKPNPKQNELAQVDTLTDDILELDDGDKTIGHDCVIMRNTKLLSNNYTIIEHIAEGQGCINHCYASRNCVGFTFSVSTRKCSISHDLGKYVPSQGNKRPISINLKVQV